MHTTPSLTTNMKIKISATAYTKLYYYIKECEDEISGFGLVVPLQDSFLITDIFIFEQTVGSAETELEKDDVAKFLMDFDAKGGDISKIKLWWHSHADMTSFFSETDTSTIETLGETFDYIVSLVGNHKMEIKTRVDIFKVGGVDSTFTEEDNEFSVWVDTNEELQKQIKKEIEEKVKSSYHWKGYTHGWKKDDNFGFNNNKKYLPKHGH